MKILKILLLVAITLLALAAGVAKIMTAPQEVAFFASLGLGTSFVMAAGIFQTGGAAAMVHPRTRLVGALVTALLFALSSAMIFASGNLVFGAVSLLPVVLALAIARTARTPDAAG